jgi:hypothetical protein
METCRPIISDPRDLADVPGLTVVCLRPAGAVAEVFAQTQGALRAIVGDEAAYWPAAHVTLAAFGTARVPSSSLDEMTIATLTGRWAAAVPTLSIGVEDLDVFAEVQIPVLPRISASPADCLADEAELVSYDGGPERLLGRFPLEGSLP